MNEFEKACKFSNERWGDSFPDGLDEPGYSAKHKRKMENLIKETETTKRSRKFTKTAKIAVAAAIVCVLSVSVFAAVSNGQYLLERFNGYFHYSVENPYDGSAEELKVGFVPEHFRKERELVNDTMIIYGYDTMKYVYRDILDENGEIPQGPDLEQYNGMEFEPYHYFDIIKMPSGMDYSFNEKDSYSMKEITVGERTYLFYVETTGNENRLVWNEGDYIYRIRGDISKEEMLRVAEHVS